MGESTRCGFYICRRMRLLEYLRKRGFIPLQTLPDVNNPKYFVWKFERTPNFEQALNDYFESLRK